MEITRKYLKLKMLIRIIISQSKNLALSFMMIWMSLILRKKSFSPSFNYLMLIRVKKLILMTFLLWFRTKEKLNLPKTMMNRINRFKNAFSKLESQWVWIYSNIFHFLENNSYQPFSSLLSFKTYWKNSISICQVKG